MSIPVDTLLRIAAVVLAVYVGVCLLLYLLQERLLFFPQSLRQTPTGSGVQPASLERNGATLRGWIVNSGSEGPLLIYFSGNAEEVSELVGLFGKLDAVTVLMNYRGYGESGGKPTVVDLIDDAAAVVAGMRERFGDDRPIVLFGRSLGSGIATLATRSGGVDGIILMSPYRSIAHIARRRYPFVPVGWLLRRNIDAVAAFDALPGRVLVLYARRDRVVPTRESLAFIEALPVRPQVVEFVGPHNIDLETPELWRAIVDFVAASRPG